MNNSDGAAGGSRKADSRVFRCFTEKKPGFDMYAAGVLRGARETLGHTRVSGVRVFNMYDISGIEERVYADVRSAVLSEPQVDNCYDGNMPVAPGWVLGVEPLPGQYDQRADSCAQCIQILTRSERPEVLTATIYVFSGELTGGDRAKLREYLINPVESREADPGALSAREPARESVAPTPAVCGLTCADDSALGAFIEDYALAMDIEDLRVFRDYFRDEAGRDPTVTELRLVDTYWSDHCRHTTFTTHIDCVDIEDEEVKRAYGRYLGARREAYGGAAARRPVTLMDIATIGAAVMKARGKLAKIDVSDEVNACSVHVGAVVDGKPEDWLLMFKNETHNHPTEIEPFGGAATCIGGAIRDPLSGRAYVYQAMRVTGAGDPRADAGATMPGKMPQRKLTTTAARGYSSYGNQIGLATGLVQELYHPGYVAKRMEVGAVVGAVRARDVTRRAPVPGDKVILLGGRTGRDGIGGATGSSKTHSRETAATMGSEVQKGNALEERKIQRLFLNPEATRMIKRCNDFGAGGVCVAIGELADGLDIDLSLVRKKYEGLNGTELAISESQERMAVVVSPGDADRFIEMAAGENLEAYPVAEVTNSRRVTMRWEGNTVADISRDFLSCGGAVKHASVRVPKRAPRSDAHSAPAKNARDALRRLAGDLRSCSQRGLISMFDGSVGAGAVLAPYGGRTMRTRPQVMASLLPLTRGETETCSVMSFGFDPYESEADPYAAARDAVITSAAKLVAAGCGPDEMYFSFQEYFEKLRNSPERWGKPFAALLGALDAQLALSAAAIGGKDSMSGSFMDMDVPPTLISFAVAPARADIVISPEFKAPGNEVVCFEPDGDYLGLWRTIQKGIADGAVISAWAVTPGGVSEGIFNMALGNGVGFKSAPGMGNRLFEPYRAGAIIAEVTRPVDGAFTLGATVADEAIIVDGESVPLRELYECWVKPLENVFPTAAATSAPGGGPAAISGVKPAPLPMRRSAARPRAAIMAFPGANGEIDAARAVERAGGAAEIVVIRNLTPSMLAQSVSDAARAVDSCQMLILPGGFSCGDEPDGSAKFITAFFRNSRLTDCVHALLKERDGLILGICNGFQALIKLGLAPFGEITPPSPDAPTLTHNTIGRHQAGYVYTRVSSVRSPWMALSRVGDVYAVPISHGEGRFVASDEHFMRLLANEQIASQYTDADGNPSMSIDVNPNGSYMAVEGIFSPDGRVFGKMGHSERRGEFVAKNIYGNKHQPIFESGVAYFR
ncbi:MAG: phosphoribosylformylglycinamidine synthase [Oscillospiraceae bacterium]|jgi:phosphoribosylformylglycinamidine synthase|nr:phosphoribosylformylglycinamidine synthase [Oscillospiraceae bacterium]